MVRENDPGQSGACSAAGEVWADGTAPAFTPSTSSGKCSRIRRASRSVPCGSPAAEAMARLRRCVVCRTCFSGEACNAFRAAGRRLPDSMLEEVAAHLCGLEGG